MKKKILSTVAALAAGAVASTAALAGPAEAAPQREAGNKSLAKVLAADGNRLDGTARDFDILEKAVLAVLDAKPSSPVGLLTDGRARLTAFLPTDGAFAKLVKGLTGSAPRSERATLDAVTSTFDIHTIENVLLYHVVVDQTLASPKVLAAAEAGTDLHMAQDGTVRVVLKRGDVVLQDHDPDVADPRAIPGLLDINRGNKQIGHGINRVLLPVDL